MDEFTIIPERSLHTGCILVANGTDKLEDGRYRVLNIRNGLAVLCMMDITSIKLNVQRTDYLHEQLSEGTLSFGEETQHVVDHDQLSDYQKKVYERNRAIVRAVSEEYGPDYLDLPTKKPKPLLKRLSQEYSLDKTNILRIIRKYLQSGFDNNSLLNAKLFVPKKTDSYGNYSSKPGRKCETVVTGKVLTAQDIANFEEALAIYKKGRKQTIKNAYLLMSNKRYSQVIENEDGTQYERLLPASERPSLRQFEYYLNKHLTREEKDRIKTSRMEQRNNKRLLLSDTRYNVHGPGDRMQMDEVEVDVSLVSSVDSSITVGRPVVYMMHDVYDGHIHAVGISFDNNSVLGMTNCFLNLAQNKVAYCQQYGIVIEEDMWPSGYLPKRIITDRGAEYTSYEAKRIFRELGIYRELAPAGTGSMKGLVEQWFHQMHSSQNPSLEGHGLIEKRHDSKHHKEACLTIEDFTKMLLNFIIHHNCSVLSDYPLTKDMISAKVDPVPTSIYKYGCQKYGCPNPIQNMAQYYFTLMLPQRAVYDRKGIQCNNLFYINPEDRDLLADMYNAHSTRIPFPVRMDPRDIGSVYYVRDNRIMRAALNDQKTGNADVAGMTLTEWLQITKTLKAKRRNLEISKQDFDAYIAVINELIVKNAIKVSTGNNDVNNLKEHREAEKHLESSRLRMFDQINNYLFGTIGEKASLLNATSIYGEQGFIALSDDEEVEATQSLLTNDTDNPQTEVIEHMPGYVKLDPAEDPVAFITMETMDRRWRRGSYD